MPRVRAFNLLFLAIGVVGLVVLVIHTGGDRIGEALVRVGFSFGLVCFAHFGVIVADSIMLWACSARAATVGQTLRASLAGHGINEATPLAKLGELTKYTLLCETMPPHRAAGALIVQNIAMFVAACATISLGSGLTLLAFDVDGALASLLVSAVVAFAIIAAGALVVLRLGIGRRPFRWLRRVGISSERLERWQSRWQEVAAHWQHVTSDRRAMRITWSAAVVSRAGEIAQAAIILAALGCDQVAAAAVMSVASFQLILWATSFIPMQVGSHEVGAYALFHAVGLAPDAGLLLELVRKLRRLVFVGVGVSVLGAAATRSLFAKDGIRD